MLWGGQLVSAAGSGVTQVAFPLLILLITHSPAQAALVGALGSLTYIICVLPAGALLDRWDRKRAMLICDSGRAISLLSIPPALAFGYLSIVQICIVAVISSALGVFFDIAELACLPQVVTKEQLSLAVGRTQTSVGIVNFISPTLGALLFALCSSLPFLADGISYIVSVCSLWIIHVPFQEQRETPRRNLHLDIVEGLRWLWHQPLLRTMALITSINVFCGAGYGLIIIVIAQQQHASDATIGLIFGIGGIGSVVGAFLAGKVQRRLSFAQIICGALWLFALFSASLALLPSPFFLGLLTALLYFLVPFYNVANVGRRLGMTPDALQSRVNSVARLIALGLSPLGWALTGLLLQFEGPRMTVLFSAGIQLFLALAATLAPSLRISQSG